MEAVQGQSHRGRNGNQRMKEPTINGTPLSQASVYDLKRLVAKDPNLFGTSAGQYDDPAISRYYAEVLLRERGQ